MRGAIEKLTCASDSSVVGMADASTPATPVNRITYVKFDLDPATGTRVDVYRDGTKIKSGTTNTGATNDGSRTAGSVARR